MPPGRRFARRRERCRARRLRRWMRRRTVAACVVQRQLWAIGKNVCAAMFSLARTAAAIWPLQSLTERWSAIAIFPVISGMPGGALSEGGGLSGVLSAVWIGWVRDANAWLSSKPFFAIALRSRITNSWSWFARVCWVA